ncbi:hypothetical protein [Deinococcus sp. Leaf326]|uniref:hypothetical protein n=1 Tax=Deinococcus sp. Leaf326 TaxID=1736338 RepID=UPI0006F319F0|nr:hypothetical protein [Deinococcus sp. Leaf326]KQR40770.1 hypothetical protein ASF71_00965 [Deinococcus sp. Leaf326]
MPRSTNTPAPPSDTLRIEYMALSDLLRWPGNPKEHAESAIAASIERFGMRDPVSIDETSGRLIAGHGRLTVLERAHAAGSPAPQFVQVRADGAWLIPVTRGGSFTDEAEASAYLVAHNRTGELGGWDDTLLAEFLKPLDEDLLAVTGFDLDAFALEQETAAAKVTLPTAPSEFLNSLIAPPAPAPAPASAAPTSAGPQAPAPLAAPSPVNPEPSGDHAVSAPAPATPTGPVSPPDAPQFPDEEYVQLVYVVKKSDRTMVLDAIKRARAEFGVDTAPDALLAIVRQYNSTGTVAA